MTDKTEASNDSDLLHRSDGIVDLRRLVPIVLRWSWIAVFGAALAAGKGLWDMHSYQPMSVASMIVSPLEQTRVTASADGGGFSQALAGLGLGQVSRTATVFDRLVHSTSTITLARRLQEKYGLLQIVFHESWDSSTSSWRQPQGEDYERAELTRRFFNLPTWTDPDLEDLAQYLGADFVVKNVAGTAFKEISFAHSDGDLALFLLQLVYDEAEALLREIDREETEERRQFLEERLRSTSSFELRAALVGLLASEARREMVTHKALPFAARVIEPPHLSKFRSRPSKIRLVYVPVLAALGITMLVIVLVALFRNE